MSATTRSSTAAALLPGLLLAGILAAAAWGLAAWLGRGVLGYETSPVSPILVAVFLGLLLRNTLGVPDRAGPGLQLVVRRVLRVGVALLGIRLSLGAVATLGVAALPLVAACIAAALLLVTALARLLSVPPRLGLLIATGTSICGITAIVATAPAIGADDDETAYAVATIALFGTLTLFAYPFLARLLFPTPVEAGLFLGTSIHDTSQVVGAALAFSEQYGAPATLDTAVVTKLLRNLTMVAVIPLVGLLHARRVRADAGARKAAQKEGAQGEGAPGDAAPASDRPATPTAGTRVRDLVPLFILGFLAMALIRTVGDLGDVPFGVLPADLWAVAVSGLQRVAEVALLLAMAAVGLGTSLRRLRALGLTPLAVGLAAALAVGVVSILSIRGLAALALLPGLR